MEGLPNKADGVGGPETGAGAATGICLSGEPDGVVVSSVRVGSFFSGLAGAEESVK